MGTPHKHAELIKAWADGAKIQWLRKDGVWVDVWLAPAWHNTDAYRIKPEPKKVQIRYYLSKAGNVGIWVNSDFSYPQEEFTRHSWFVKWLSDTEEREFDV